MWVFISLAVLLVALTHWFLNGSYGYWKQRGVPSPPTKPGFGNLGATFVQAKSLGQIYLDMYNNYKDYLYIGFYKIRQPALLIRDVELIKSITIKDFSSFHDNDITTDESIDPIFGKNPFVLKGRKWKLVRTQVTSAITSGRIKSMFTLMDNVGKNLVTYLKQEPDAIGKDGLDTKELAAKYTTDVVAACAFGLEGKSFTDPDAAFRTMGRKLFNPGAWTDLKFTFLFVLPGLAKFFKVKLISDDIRDFFVGTLSEAIKYREKNDVKRNDYLDLMLSLKSKPGEYEFTNDDVMAQAMTFFLDGFETSSVTLSFTLYELARNPGVQETLRREVDTVLAKHGGEVTYEAMQEMNYLDMVLSESLRKYPPLMFVAKTCTKDHTLPAPKGAGNGPDVSVKLGTCIAIPVYAIHHDPQFYPQPEKFDPERFTEDAKNARPKCAYMPFGEGPRMCLGFRFALTQIKAAIISVIANFEIKENAKTPRTFEMDPTTFLLTKKGGLFLNYYKRTK